MSKPLLQRMVSVVGRALDLAGVKKEAIYSAEAVGGGIRIPMISHALKEFLQRDISLTCDGDESVARGCVLQESELLPPVLTLF